MIKKILHNVFNWLILLIFLEAGVVKANNSDVLYIGSGNVISYDAITGEKLGEFGVSCNPYNPATSGPCSAFGMFVRGGQLFVANNNVDQGIPGDIMRFNTKNGHSLAKLVLPVINGANNPNAPGIPRGLISWKGKTFVADLSVGNPNCDPDGANCSPGAIAVYNSGNGALLKRLKPDSSFDISKFHPEGLVIGPDGLLYASVRNLPPTENFLIGGSVVRFDPKTGKYLGVFINSELCKCGLNRPDGMAFGPDGNLYITSFRSDANDNDKILIFKGPNVHHNYHKLKDKHKPGDYLSKIDLADPVAVSGDPKERAFAQAVLFGPNDYLYVPITGPGPCCGTEGNYGGDVRRYDVTDIYHPQLVDSYIQPFPRGSGGGWYLTFGGTDPGTLVYKKDDHKKEH